MLNFRSNTFGTKPASGFHSGEISSAKPDPSFQSTQEGFVTQSMIRRLPKRHPTAAETEPEIIIPSIESPKSVKHDDKATVEGNNTAIAVDSPTYEKQIRYGRMLPAEHYNGPYQLSLKRRREASPIRSQQSSRQVLLQSTDSIHHAQHQIPPAVSGRNEVMEQGNVKYLSTIENIGPSITSLRTNFSTSQKPLIEDEQYRRRQLLPNFSYGNSVIGSEGNHSKDSSKHTRAFPKKPPGHMLQTRSVLGAPDAPDSHFKYYDHSGKQIYITGRPIVEISSAQSQPQNTVHPALSRSRRMAREPISTGQENPSLQSFPLGQPSLQNERSIVKEVNARYEPLKVTRIAGDMILGGKSEQYEWFVPAAQGNAYTTADAMKNGLHHHPEMRGSYQINMLPPADAGRYSRFALFE